MLRKLIARILLLALFMQFFAPINISPVHAVDTDGTANLDLTVVSSVEPESIIGTSFTVDINLSNATSSESDAFSPGFIVKLPPNVVFVGSSDLGSPVRTETLSDGSTLLFFETDGFIPKGSSDNFALNLSSNTSADLFTPTDIEVLAYAEDNIYGVGSAPSGSPAGTLDGGYDYAGSTNDPTDPDFPDNIDGTTDLSTLPFFPTTTQFIPFNIEKLGPGELLIGEVGTTTLRVTGNNLGGLNDFEIIDIIPNSRKFVGFTNIAGATTSVAYDTPNVGEVTLTISNIDVPTGGVVDIQYETLALAYEAASYSGSTVLLNTGSLINDQTISTNTASQQPTGTWNDGGGIINVTPTSVIEPQDYDAILSFGELSKSVNNPSPVIGDTIRYTITYDIAQNMSYDSNNGGTQIEDLLPDGLSFISEISSINSGGDSLSLTTNTTNSDGETTLIWTLGAGDTIEAGDFLTIVYDVLVDGIYEGAGDQQFENTQVITNTAEFSGNIVDSGNNQEWGYTDSSLIDTEDTDTASADVTAPSPTNDKQLISIVFPDGTIYNSSNPLPAGASIPVGSRLDFNIHMDFPNVFSTGAKLVDALPLVTGPNTDTYNIAFQTTPGLLDMSGNPVFINDDNNDGTADTSFNGQTLGGTTPTDTAWITTTPANSLEFDIAGGSNAKTFSIGFSVDVLPIAPSGGAQSSLPIKNVLIGSFSNDIGSINSLDIVKEPFVLGFPIIEVEKDVRPDPTNNIAFGDSVTYNVRIQNTGDAGGYLENIVDTLPENMLLDSFSAVYDGSDATAVPGLAVTQSGSTLEILFNVDPTLNRSYLNIDDTNTTDTDESVILLTYTVSPTIDFVIVGGESRTNTIMLDYYSTGDAPSNDLNKIDTIEDEAVFTVASPTVTRTYFSTSEADSPTNGGGGRPDIHAGEESVFETTITLPPGTYTNSRFTENLLTTRLNFLTGSVISTGPDLSFETGTGFTSNIINFGDIVNSGTGPQTIVIQTTAIGRNDTTRRNNNRARGDFRYSGQTIQRNTPVDLIIPTLNITKEVNPTEVDTDDTFTYTIEIEHTATSNATAYDVLLKDILPANISYISGTLAGNTNFTGTEADLFSGSGILLDNLDVGDTETLVFDATIGTGATATTSETNTATIDYSTLDDDGSIVEANFSATGTADVIVKGIEVTHYITSTNNNDTGTNQFTTSYEDLTIGEEVTYNIEIDIPELIFSGVTLTQTLPAGIQFSSGFTLTDGVKSHTIDTFTINSDGTVTFDFGDIDNTGVGAGTGFLLQTTAVVTDMVGNSAGDTINSSILLEYDGDSSSSDNTPNFDIIEPGANITKTYTPDTGDGGDSLTTTITVTNPGTAPLYDVSWIDTLPPKTTGGAGYLASSSTGVLLPGESITYTYNTILDSTVVYGEMLTGTASVAGDSMPGTEAEERDYSDAASDIITIIGITGLQKDLTSSGTATVGDVESYILRIPVPEGVTGNITINDLIPAGMEVIPGSISITSSGGLSYSGTVIPTIGSVSVGNTQTVDYIFDSVTNNNTDNTVTEYITITYDAVVLNTSDNNAGDTKAENVTVDYNSSTSTLTDSPVPIDILEPSVGIDLISTYTYGNDVLYTYTITNTGSSTAYDLDIDSILPAGLSYSGAITITNSGGVVGIVQAGEDFTIEELPVNTGSPLQFTIAGVIDSTIGDMDTLSVDTNITYTGQDDTYTSVVSNTNNTERTGDNTGENDYLDEDPDTITVLLPILDESISVIDLNGGVGIIGDIFEYTITLTNTGSVDLTDISALLDIPAEFTGFTIISTPSGSTNNSSGSGGTNNTGQVDISDIDLLIGQSVTIIYQVTASETVVSGTTVNSEVTVSDSPEGATGGTPDIDITILAPAVQLSKSITGIGFSEPTVPNDTITYEFVVTNTGDVELYNVVVSDPMLGGDITASCSFPGTGATLSPSASATCNPANYPLSTSDIIRGYVENSAEVMSEDESMNPVNDISDAGVGNEATETTSGTGATDGDPTNDPTVQPLSQEPELTVTKVITGTGFNVPNLVGDTISYSITIENTGNLNITDITITDPLFGGDITSSCVFPTSATVGLDIDEIATCTPSDYSIDANDIIRGYVDNNATARGTDALGDTVNDVSDPGDESTETPSGDGTTTDGNPTNDPTTIEIIGEPELTLTKTVASDTLSTPTSSGNTISYQIVVENTGQLPVSNITVSDPLLSGDITSSCTFPISSSDGLEVGESATCNPDAYSVLETNIVTGAITNRATTNGIDPNTDPVTSSGSHIQSLIQNPDWEITKTATSTPVKVGDTISYEFAIENTGNISVVSMSITDDKCQSAPTLDPSSDIGTDGNISPGEKWTYTCTSIPVTQTEVDAGTVTNTVSVSGATLLGSLPDIDDTLNTSITTTPLFEVEKKSLSVPLKANDTIEYEFTVTNTGNVSINNINLTDDKCATTIEFDNSTDVGNDGLLFQDESWVYTCTSIPVTQQEADDGEVMNSVDVSGTPTRGTLEDVADIISTPVGPTPRWEIMKETSSTPTQADDTLEYKFTLRNTGNVTISDINITDNKCSSTPVLTATTDINSDELLSPFEVWTYTCTSIGVTQAEIDDGEVLNDVIASGTPAGGILEDVTDSISTEIIPTPSVQLYKVGVFNEDSSQTITYSMTIKNTGNVTLSNIILQDNLLGGDISESCTPQSALSGLAPNDTINCESIYQITDSDIINQYVENTASVTADDPNATGVSDISDAGDDTTFEPDNAGNGDSDPTNDPTVVFIPSNLSFSGGGSGTTYCRDPKATNYRAGGEKDNRKCIYEEDEEENSNDNEEDTENSNNNEVKYDNGNEENNESETNTIPEISDENLNNNPSRDVQENEDNEEENLEFNSAPEEVSIEERVNDLKSKFDTDISEKIKNYEDVLAQAQEVTNDTIKGESLLKALPKELPRTGTPISERVNTILSPNVYTGLPDASTFRLAGDTNENISHWKQVLIEEDRNANKYIVIPSNGLIMPINEFGEDSPEFENMINGREGKIMPSLRTGALEYPGASTRGYGEVGNKVVFAHSSYFTEASGRYKTHFQKIIELDRGEEVWIYEKNSTGNYTLYKYQTEKSYETDDQDTSVLLPGEGKNLTLFTCTPIGGITGRWIIKAKFIEQEQIETESATPAISQKYKLAIGRFISRINDIQDDMKRLETLYLIYERLDTLRSTYEGNEKMLELLNYIQYRIAKSIVSQ